MGSGLVLRNWYLVPPTLRRAESDTEDVVLGPRAGAAGKLESVEEEDHGEDDDVQGLILGLCTRFSWHSGSHRCGEELCKHFAVGDGEYPL